MRFLAKVFGIADVSSKLAKGPRSCESQKSGLSSLPRFFGTRPTRNEVMKGNFAEIKNVDVVYK